MNEYISPTVLNLIHKCVDFSEIIPIKKGYSSDLKYLLITPSSRKYLARITPVGDARAISSMRDQYNLLKDLSKFSLYIPKPHQFQIDDDGRLCLLILDYVDGEDGEEALIRLSCEDQYRIGFQAGEELKKLHKLSAPPETPPWFMMKLRKHEWYCSEFSRNPVDTKGVNLDVIQQFITKNVYLLEGVRQTFQHDDYHPANLIIHDGHLNGIIDFNRSDWGDPIHDFYKLALFTRNISISFARGQVDGYYNGSPSYDFWNRYALYCAMSIIPDLVWSGKQSNLTGSDELKHSFRRIRTMISDHEGFTRIIPLWYRQ
ncbi:aminoglycoside phosphotransferase family protein [Methanospirillum lacunae]|uniref:Aminoglycoside phosphotransferase n=1 Tax=Methanospirillum lacunae TaxID=668570 RepID=A0A2V2N7T8_9EURY|nr:aminoglycoside phosphotransferase family protein [Methanospirillum lacunae]PWR71343.1 aminoglycoside phosphotransferase [Methanospirillum lacunae]